MTDPTILKGIIALARSNLKSDPGLAVFIVRDLPEVEEAGLDDLAWTICRHGCSQDDATDFLDRLEKSIAEANNA